MKKSRIGTFYFFVILTFIIFNFTVCDTGNTQSGFNDPTINDPTIDDPTIDDPTISSSELHASYFEPIDAFGNVVTSAISRSINMDLVVSYRVVRGTVAPPDIVNIPSEYNGKPVTAIGRAGDTEINGAFSNRKNITSVHIPSSVKYFGDNAFRNCEKITSITIPEGTISINSYAFANININAISIPASVTSIETYAFFNCFLLNSINFAPNSNLENISYWAFAGCIALTSITIPSSVEFIAGNAFGGCTNLVSINVDASNSSYSSVDGVLYNNSISQLIRVPQGMTGEINIPSSVASFSDDAFFNCIHLTGINVDIANITYSSESGIIYNKPKTEIIYVPLDISGVVTIPSSVTTINTNMFNVTGRTNSLTAINVDEGNNNYSSENGILYNKSKTEIIYVPLGINGVINLPLSITSLGGWSFSWRENLTSITIPPSVTSIGAEAFTGCSNLTSIIINSSSVSIGTYAFMYCTNISNITIPNGATLGYDVFCNWTPSQTITIKGKADKASTVSAGWDPSWDYNCGANIVYEL